MKTTRALIIAAAAALIAASAAVADEPPGRWLPPRAEPSLELKPVPWPGAPQREGSPWYRPLPPSSYDIYIDQLQRDGVLGNPYRVAPPQECCPRPAYRPRY